MKRISNKGQKDNGIAKHAQTSQLKKDKTRPIHSWGHADT